MFVALVAESDGVLETTGEIPQPSCVGNHGGVVQIVGGAGRGLDRKSVV